MVGMHYPGGSTTLGGNMIFDVIYTLYSRPPEPAVGYSNTSAIEVFYFVKKNFVIGILVLYPKVC